MRIIVGAMLLLATATAFAQRVPLGVPVPDQSSRHDRRAAREAEEEQTAPQEALLGSAKRDGDETLTCEQLQAEMTTMQADPAMQALTAQGAGDQLGGGVSQLVEQMQANRPSVTGTVVKGMAQSLNPFGQIGARRRASRQQAEVESQVAEIQKSLPAGFLGADGQPGGGNTSLLMRMGEVMQLAQAKNCDFMNSTQPTLQTTEPARESK